MDRAEVVVMCLAVACYHKVCERSELVGVAIGALLALFLRLVFVREPREKQP